MEKCSRSLNQNFGCCILWSDTAFLFFIWSCFQGFSLLLVLQWCYNWGTDFLVKTPLVGYWDHFLFLSNAWLWLLSTSFKPASAGSVAPKFEWHMLFSQVSLREAGVWNAAIERFNKTFTASPDLWNACLCFLELCFGSGLQRQPGSLCRIRRGAEPSFCQVSLL